MTTNNQQTEQGGVSALKAIEFIQPMLKEILEKVEQDGEKAAAPALTEQFGASFDKMSDEELFLLGHRIDTLQQVTNVLLVIVATRAMARLSAKLPVDPRLS